MRAFPPTSICRGVPTLSDSMAFVSRKGQGRLWFRTACSEKYACPSCNEIAPLSELVYDPYLPISYYGFAPAQCPHCKAILTYDFERKMLTRRGEERQPPRIMLGLGRYLDFILALVGIGFLVAGNLLWIPIAFCALMLVEYAWELVLKANNPGWFVWDTEFEWLTNRLSVLGIPFSIAKWCLAVAGLYHICV